jgi:hypothetical protein
MKVFLDEEDHENGNGCGDMVVNGGWCRISPFIPADFFFSVDNSSSFPLVSSPPSESLSLSLSLSIFQSKLFSFLLEILSVNWQPVCCLTYAFF